MSYQKVLSRYSGGSGSTGYNFFGTGEDGYLVVSADTNLTSTTDGLFVFKQYESLTINSGKTLNFSNRCQGGVILIKGDLTVNGTFDMSKGANLAGLSTTFARYGVNGLTSSNMERAAIVTFNTPAAGASGGATNNNGIKKNGSAGSNGQTGGGGSGAGAVGGGGQIGNGGAGSAGTSYSGGTGGAGGSYDGTTGVAGGAGATNGGAGGSVGTVAGAGRRDAAGGGAGNAGGTGGQVNNTGSGAVGSPGGTGTGGTLYIIVGGNITVGAAGIIQCNGSNGGNANANGATGSNYANSGGASGAGRLVLLYAGTYSNSGSVVTNGGTGGVGSGATNLSGGGGDGGAGTITTQQISV